MICDAWKEEKTKVSQPHLGEPRHGPHTPIFTEMAAAGPRLSTSEKIQVSFVYLEPFGQFILLSRETYGMEIHVK